MNRRSQRAATAATDRRAPPTEQHHQRPARPRPGPRCVRRRLRPRRLGHPGPQLYRQDDGLAAFRCEVNYDFGGAKLTSITGYRDYKCRPGRRLRLQHGRHPLPRRTTAARPQVQDLQPGTAAPGHGVQRQARLAGRRLFRQRGPDAHRQSAVRQPIRPLRDLPPASPAAPCRALQSGQHELSSAPASAGPSIAGAGAGGAVTVRSAARCPRRDRPARYAQRSRQRRGDTLQAEQPQLGAVHAQHLPRTPTVRCHGRPSLHQRAQETRRDLRQRQHRLHAEPGRRRFRSSPTRRCPPVGPAGILGLSCQGNSTAELNGVSIDDKRKREQVHRHRRAVVQAERRPAALRQLFARL